jgi:hypothetical protein
LTKNSNTLIIFLGIAVTKSNVVRQ